LDNTFWLTLDLGLDIKVIDASADVDALPAPNAIVPTPAVPVYSGSETVALPLVYVRGRIQVPGTGLGLESDVKYITYSGSTAYDVRAKVDWTFDITPVIQTGVEVGYRMQKYDLEDGLNVADLSYNGVYGGLMLRF
jgi:outer membrane protein